MHDEPRIIDHPRMPKVGHLVAGRYQVQQLLGEGGFGAVYLAIDQRAGGRLALKVLDPDKSDHPRFASRFKQEVMVVRNLTHHNTIKIWDVGETDAGCLFMAMEYVDGEPLGQLVAREGRLGPERVQRIAQQVLLSLAEAHHNGIVHRDLKPDNIMVRQLMGEPDYVTVLDFGIAKAFGDLSLVKTQTGMALFTPAYAAPELLRNRGVCAASDVYAVGLILIEALTGRKAVEGDTGADIIVQQMSPQPIALPDAVRGLPIGAVIERAVAKDVAQRYVDAQAMLEALQALATPSQPSLSAQPVRAAQAAPQPGRPLTGELPSENDLVAGRYRVQRLLGEGGFAKVFLASDELAGGELALKVIDPRRGGQKIADRFRQEVMVVRQLKHHNSIKIWDVGQTETGALFMAMERVDGEPLDDVLQRQGGLSRDRVVRITTQILRSLAEAHGIGVVHRDLKPGNVMVCQLPGEPDYVKVLDFGIAKALEPALAMVKTQTGMIMCTPQYASPELIRSRGIGPHTDIYALGLMMIEMFTGTQVYQAPSVMEIIAAQMAPEPVRLPGFLETDPLAPVIRRAVAKDTGQRYRTAEEMLHALSAVGASAQAPAPALSRVSQANSAPAASRAVGTSSAGAQASWQASPQRQEASSSQLQPAPQTPHGLAQPGPATPQAVSQPAAVHASAGTTEYATHSAETARYAGSTSAGSGTGWGPTASQPWGPAQASPSASSPSTPAPQPAQPSQVSPAWSGTAGAASQSGAVSQTGTVGSGAVGSGAVGAGGSAAVSGEASWSGASGGDQVGAAPSSRGKGWLLAVGGLAAVGLVVLIVALATGGDGDAGEGSSAERGGDRGAGGGEGADESSLSTGLAEVERALEDGDLDAAENLVASLSARFPADPGVARLQGRIEVMRELGVQTTVDGPGLAPDRDTLVGMWGASAFAAAEPGDESAARLAESLSQAEFVMEFREDGTFTQLSRLGGESRSATGSWEVTRSEGAEIDLSTTVSEGGDAETETRTLRFSDRDTLSFEMSDIRSTWTRLSTDRQREVRRRWEAERAARREAEAEREAEARREAEREAEARREAEREEEARREAEREEEARREAERQAEARREAEEEEEARRAAERAARQEAEREAREEAEEEEPEQAEVDVDELVRDARRLGIGGRYRDAIDLLEQAREADPGESRIYLMLYTNYSRMGDDRRAARALREYLRREPDDANAAEYREIIERLEGGGY